MNRWLPAILIFAILAFLRVLGSAFSHSFPNFQPLPAILLCSIVFLKGHQRWLIPALVWTLTGPIASQLQGYPVFCWEALGLLPAILATVAIALWNAKRPTVMVTLFGAVISACVFYFVSNTVSFAIDPLYAKTWDGFVRAQWTGPVNLGPTWLFLRNLMAANILFTTLFLLARKSLPAPAMEHTPAIAR